MIFANWRRKKGLLVKILIHISLATGVKYLVIQLFIKYTYSLQTVHSWCLFFHLSFPMERLYIPGKVGLSLFREYHILFSVVKDVGFAYEYRKRFSDIYSFIDYKPQLSTYYVAATGMPPVLMG